MYGWRADAASMQVHGRRRRSRRGYTLIEVVGATVLFVLIVTLLASTTATIVSSRSQLRQAAEIDGEIEDLLDQVTTSSYSDLLADSFTVPALCPGDAQGTGTLARSCVQVAGQPLTISWQLRRGDDAAGDGGGPLEAADDVTVTATAARTDGSLVVRTRTIPAPMPGWRDGYGTVRVRLTGAVDAMIADQRPLLLLSGTGFGDIVAAARPASDGSVVLRALPGDCSLATPCRLGLGTGDGRGISDELTLDAQTVVGPAGLVVLTENRAVDTRVAVSRRGRLSLQIDVNDPVGLRHVGLTDAAPEASSVCVWASFDDGYRRQVQPVCNSLDSGLRIPFDTYQPEPSDPAVVAFPNDTPLALAADSPTSDTCPVVPGQRYHNGTQWATVSTVGVCSSWTWGRAASVIVAPDSTVRELPASVTLTGGSSQSGLLVFDTSIEPSAVAAVGYGRQPAFSKPRSATNCPGWPTTCAPVWVTGVSVDAPEDTLCQLQHCLSAVNAAPALARVDSGVSYATQRSWPYAVPTTPSAQLSFRTYFQDNEAGSVSVTLVTKPAVGLLEACTPVCASVTNGQVVKANLATTASVDTNAYVEWRYTAPASFTGASVELRVSDGLSNRTERVLLSSSDSAPVAVQALDGTASQGSSTLVYARVFSALGTLGAGSVVWGGVPAGSAWSQNVAAGGTGWASARFTASTSVAVRHTATAVIQSNSALVISAPAVQVLSRPAAISVTPASLAASQGGSPAAQATVTVTDASGGVLRNWPVSISALSASVAWRGVAFLTPVCVTGNDGRCTAPSAEISAATTVGSGQIRFAAANKTATLALTVTQRAARLRSSNPEVPQGGSSSLTITVLDGAGSPMPNQAVQLTAPVGVSLSQSSVVTASNGTITVVATAAANTAAGQRPVTVKVARSGAEDLVTTAQLTIISVASTASLTPGNVTLAPGSTYEATLDVRDASDSPVAGAWVDPSLTSCTNGIKVSSGMSTGSDGLVSVIVEAPVDQQPTTATCSVKVAGLNPRSINVVVP